MTFVVKYRMDRRQQLRFAMKVLVWLLIVNSTVSFLLWVLQTLSLFYLILTYEALFILILGAFQILSSRIYREDSVPNRYGGRIAWWDFRKFAKLTSEERQRSRQEGLIMVIFGLVLLVAVVIVNFYLLLRV